MKKFLMTIPMVLMIGFIFVLSQIKEHEIAAMIPIEQTTEANQFSDDDDDEELPPSNADFKEFIELAEEVYEYRKDRLPNFAIWSKMATEPNTIILDGRSKEAFDKLHVKGAINFDFSDFSAPKLAKVIPNKDTRILIYCNNNFFDAPNWNDSASKEEKVKTKESVKSPEGATKEEKALTNKNRNNGLSSVPPGAKGPAGPTGTQSSAGPKNPKETIGVQDPAAANGSSAPIGKAGIQGPAGAKLPEGAAGPAGPKGPPGPYVVMEGSKVLNLPGAAGPAGEQGPQPIGTKTPKNDSPKSDKWQWNPNNPNGSPLALNIPIFINLYYYGYTNLYELGESVPLSHPHLELEGSVTK